jgi:multidrug efflux pump subunit AcrA (membrane-fusion protein)
VEGAEAGWVARQDQRVALENAIALYPIRIQEAEKMASAAELTVKTARLNLERTTVEAPFTGRVIRVAVEKGSVVGPGMEVARIAKGGALEVAVPIDGAECARWFPFADRSVKPSVRDSDPWWFSNPDPGVEARVRWIEMGDPGYWVGRLDRIERFDPRTRTAVIVVVLGSVDAWRGLEPGMEDPPYRLVEGMFCRVEIPGCSMGLVLAVPSASVDQDGSIFVSREGRLAKIRVDRVVRREESWTYVTGGLTVGDEVLTTRAHHLVEGTRIAEVRRTGSVKEGGR